MEQTRIPEISIPTSRIGLGTWALGGAQWGGTDDARSIATIRTALDQGISLIDTAPAAYVLLYHSIRSPLICVSV